MLYKFNYFDSAHINAVIIWLIICSIIIILPFFFNGLEKTKYTVVLGVFCLAMKIFDIFYRQHFEHEWWLTTIPLNLCNVSLILGGFYLITKNNLLFNLVYFYFPGAILAVLFPGLGYYVTPSYIYVFIGTHMIEIMVVIFAFIHLDARLTKKGLYVALLAYLGMSLLARLLNNLTGANFMYLNDYIIPAVSFIKPINLYAIIFTILFMISMIATFLPFINYDNEEVEEHTVG